MNARKIILVVSIIYILLAPVAFLLAVGNSFTAGNPGGTTNQLEHSIMLEEILAAALFIVGGTAWAFYSYGQTRLALLLLVLPPLIFAVTSMI